MIPNEHPPKGTTTTFRFKAIGPVKHAELDLGDLTVIAGRNNTGKTYLVYTLYGFLKMWPVLSRVERYFVSPNKPVEHFPDMTRIARELERNGRASFAVTDGALDLQRVTLLKALASDFSEQAISQVFSSPQRDFIGSSIEIEYHASHDGKKAVAGQLADGLPLSIELEGGQVVLKYTGRRQRSASEMELLIPSAYIQFLLQDLFPAPFILSAERFGISLFYRELDFTKNQLVDMLQKMGDDKNRERLSPFLVIDRATSRYALPIKDNIDYTRTISDLRNGDNSALYEHRLFDDIKDMMAGYYSASEDEIRFISKSRGKGRSFNIPLHRASSSARGLSDLYFFLRHVAGSNHLLIVDEPESHLDTANQIELARLLARFVRAGLKVLVTTHSDYLIKEFNNLVMLSSSFSGKDTVVKQLGYGPDDALEADAIRAYVAENGGLTRCSVDQFGIDMPVFDHTIDNINVAANELASRLEQEKQA